MSKRPILPAPPHWATRLLHGFCAPHRLEEIESDLEELFYQRVTSVGIHQARWRYIRDVLSLIQPFIIKRNSVHYSNPTPAHMLRNYGQIAWRNLVRHKSFSAINILGLALGMACSLLIYLWVSDERSYDGFHANGKRIYKLIVHSKDKDGSITDSFDATPGLLAQALKHEIPEVSHAITLMWESGRLVTVGPKKGQQKGRYVNADFFAMFSFPILKGNPKTVLAAPNQIAISQQLADTYFGQTNPLGQTIRIDNAKYYQVSGVFATMPINSSIRCDFILPFSDFLTDYPWVNAGWDNYNTQTYVMLRADASPQQVNAKIKHFLTQHDKTIADKTLALQAYPQMYLYSRFTKGVADGGRIEYVQLFAIIAGLILLIACINFMNLTTARSIKRAKEVGVRKVVGAGKGLLFGQFIGEALLTTLLSAVLAIGLVLVSLPAFNSLTQKQLSIQWADPQVLLTLLGFMLLTGLVAGSYPAFVLSSLSPVRVLKGLFTTHPGAATFRQGLVVFQFSLALILMVSTAFIYRQIHYIQTKDLGLDRENIIYFPLKQSLAAHYDALAGELTRSGTTLAISRTNWIPTNVNAATSSISWPGKDPTDETSFWQLSVGYDFVKTMHIQLAEGRDFSPAFGTDSANYLINEAAARRLHLKQVVGSTFTHEGKTGKIIGVLKNFHLQSLHTPIAPLYLDFLPSGGTAVIRTRAGRTKDALALLKASSKRYNPDNIFDYQLADVLFSQQYSRELMVGQLASLFAFLAIFISCLGLFGLATFTAEQRTKEIGVRKVLGASISSIVGLLSRDFTKLVLIAIVIASPVAWYSIHRWLGNYAYKTDMAWWVFAGAALLAVGIGLLTVSFQSVKVALMNPVRSLRSE